jgi:hypothetical protein
MIQELAKSDPSIEVDSSMRQFQQVPCIQAEGGRLSVDAFMAMALDEEATHSRLSLSGSPPS